MSRAVSRNWARRQPRRAQTTARMGGSQDVHQSINRHGPATFTSSPLAAQVSRLLYPNWVTTKLGHHLPTATFKTKVKPPRTLASFRRPHSALESSATVTKTPFS